MPEAEISGPLNGIIITVAWKDGLGHPGFRKNSPVPTHPTLADHFDVKLFGVDTVKTPNPESPQTINWEKIILPLTNQKVRQYGQSQLVDGNRTVSILARASWSNFKEFSASLELAQDSIWVKGPDIGNREMFFEASSDRHLTGQSNPAQAYVVLTPGEISKGHTEFVGIAR